jgi:TRAP-type C4-dicarboxylate transport system permease small subunit
LKVARALAVIYAALCCLSLAILAIGTFGWFGQERDPVSAAFAILLSAPWPMLVDSINDPVTGIFIVLGGMGVNLFIILSLGRLLARSSAKETRD